MQLSMKKHFSSPFSLIASHFLPLLLSVQNARGTEPMKRMDPLRWFEEDAFLTFVKRRSNFEQFYEKTDEATRKGLAREHLAQKYAARLSAVHLMWEHWDCANVVQQIQGEHREKCQTFRHYLDIVYEYLLRLYTEAVDQKLSEQMPAVKPKFQCGEWVEPMLTVVEQLVRISMFYFRAESEEETRHKDGTFQLLEECEPKLLNEEALRGVDELIRTNQKHWAGAEAGRMLAQIGEALRNGDEFLDHFHGEMFQSDSKKRYSAETVRKLFRTKLSLMLSNTKKNVAEEEMDKTGEKEDKKSYQDKYFGYLNSPFPVDHN